LNFKVNKLLKLKQKKPGKKRKRKKAKMKKLKLIKKMRFLMNRLNCFLNGKLSKRKKLLNLHYPRLELLVKVSMKILNGPVL